MKISDSEFVLSLIPTLLNGNTLIYQHLKVTTENTTATFQQFCFCLHAIVVVTLFLLFRAIWCCVLLFISWLHFTFVASLTFYGISKKKMRYRIFKTEFYEFTNTHTHTQMDTKYYLHTHVFTLKQTRP